MEFKGKEFTNPHETWYPEKFVVVGSKWLL